MAGELNHEPEKILSEVIRGLGHVTDPADGESWPGFVSRMPPTPNNTVAFIGTEPVINGRIAIDGETQELHGVQVLVRSDNQSVGGLKMRDITDAADAVSNVEVEIDDDTYLVQTITRSSGPRRLGVEAQTRRRRWSVNFLVGIRLQPEE